MAIEQSEEVSINPLSEGQLNHVKFFALFIVSYLLADIFTISLNNLLPGVFSFLSKIFQNYTNPLVFVILLIIFARTLIFAIPELYLSEIPTWTIIIAITLILAHPILLVFSGNAFLIIWILFDLIESGNTLFILMDHGLLLFGAYTVSQIQIRSIPFEERFYKYLKYLGKEIVTLLVVVGIIFYIAQTALSGQFDVLNVTKPVKFILVLLFLFSSMPQDTKKTYVDKTDKMPK